MAHTKSTGTSHNARESESKRLGVKLFAGQSAKIGSIIIRQRGSKYLAGAGVKTGKDDTIYAMKPGKVKFQTKRIKRYDGSNRIVSFVHIV